MKNTCFSWLFDVYTEGSLFQNLKPTKPVNGTDFDYQVYLLTILTPKITMLHKVNVCLNSMKKFALIYPQFHPIKYDTSPPPSFFRNSENLE
jgi:hypothetical protein